jgi:hypothetical protein
MEVEFTLTPEDVRAIRRYSAVQADTRSGKPLWFLWGMLMPGFFVLCLAPTQLLEREFLYALGGGLLFGSFWVLGLALWKARGDARRFDNNPHNQWLFGTYRVTLSAKGVTVFSDHRTTTDQWSIIWHIGKTAKHMLFFITTTNAYIIPRRAFRDDKHFEEFIALARQFQEASQAEVILDALPARPTGITRPHHP